METLYPVVEIKCSEDIVKKTVIALIVISIVIAIPLFALIPITFSIVVYSFYLLTVIFGLLMMRELRLSVVVYVDRILIEKGSKSRLIMFDNIYRILIYPRMFTISLRAFPLPSASDRHIKLPKIRATTYIVSIILRSNEEIHFQLFEDEKEAFIRAFDKIRSLNRSIPSIEVLF